MNSTKTYIENRKNILSIYFTAEYPTKGSTQEMIRSLAQSGVDMIEIGIPFSDPLADGPVIQKSSKIALENGFMLKNLFNDMKAVYQEVKIPLVLMGYFNTVLAFGIENFLKQCKAVNIDTVILPDLPPEVYEKQYQQLFKKYEVAPVFLITPQTPLERLNYINNLSNAFIYAVADTSITGSKSGFSDKQVAYFKRIKQYSFKVPVIVGFGISDKETYTEACHYAHGVIIGSAFINAIDQTKNLNKSVKQFIQFIKN
ncbi:MAG: tryptophan synthase subunit alpha [Bacteroidetes bacterium]|jgi:tryptophan synthase alpha chain|nr:tryptophan synthase subunit alpha [Bacteroidota bacterium]